MKEAIANMIKNWKTSLSGLIVIALLMSYLKNAITFEQMGVAVTTFAGLGLIVAKDGNKTGA